MVSHEKYTHHHSDIVLKRPLLRAIATAGVHVDQCLSIGVTLQTLRVYYSRTRTHANRRDRRASGAVGDLGTTTPRTRTTTRTTTTTTPRDAAAAVARASVFARHVTTRADDDDGRDDDDDAEDDGRDDDRGDAQTPR